MGSDNEYEHQSEWRDNMKFVNDFYWPLKFKNTYRITGQSTGDLVPDHTDDKGNVWYKYQSKNENKTNKP